MATYVNDLRLKEIATGDESGTWGTSTNTNLELIAEAFSFGTEAITTNADTHTTTIADGATDPGRSIFLKYTGTLDSACTITIGPNTVSKLWFIENGTSGSQNIIISQGSGANITIPAGDTKIVYSDGAGSGAAIVDALASISAVDLKVQDDLTVTDDATIGGTLGVTGIVTLTDDLIIGDGKTIGSASDVDAMTIASNGQVTFTQTLIGTALDISGDIDVDGTTNLDVVDIDGAVDMASTLAVGGATTVTQSSAATAATFKVGDNSAQVANVVVSNDADTGLNLGVFGSSAGTAGMISASDAFITTSTTELNVGVNNSSGVLKFGVGNGSGTASERLRIHSNGSIGVNQSSPSSTFVLDVGGAVRSQADAPSFNLVESDSSNQHWQLGSFGGVYCLRNVTAGTFPFQVNTTGVGFNTAADRELHLKAAIPRFRIEDTDGGYSEISGNGGHLTLSADGGASQSASRMAFEVDGSEVARATSDLHFLIGTTTNQGVGGISFQHASSGVNIQQNSDSTSGGYEFYVFRRNSTQIGSINQSSTNAVTYNTSSDARLKDVTGSARGLDVINNLNPVAYNWKADNHADEGLIAQEVEKLVPNAVNQDEDGYYSMDYSKLVTHLVKGMQEQQEQIESLKSEILSLKEK